MYASSKIFESVDELRKRKITEADEVFSSSEIDFIKIPEIAPKRLTPSSLEKLYDDTAGTAEAADAESRSKRELYPEIDELFEKLAKENVRFGFNEFGTLVHAYLENAMQGLTFDAMKFAAAKYMRKLSESQQEKMSAVCEKICARFAESEYGAPAVRARESGAWIKTEYGFKMGVDGYIVTGSIDLVFENGDGTYTIVDYKTDHEIDPARYYRQQACYRKAVAALRNVPEKNVRCVLYYVRSDEFAEIPHGDFSLEDAAHDR